MQNQYLPDDLQADDQRIEIGIVAREETDRLNEYGKIYALTHPFPEEPGHVSFWKNMGFEAVAFYLAAIGGVVVAAIRTGGMFMATEEMIIQQLGVTSNAFYRALPVVTMVASLFAFELYLFAIGLRKGRESGRLNTSWWGTGAAGAVSILSGAISSLPLVGVGTTNGIELYFSWLLVIGMSVGATLLSYLGAENIGVLHNIHDKKVYDKFQGWIQDKATWYTKMQTDYRSKGRNRIFGMDNFNVQKKAVTKEDKQKSRSIQQDVRDYLQERGLSAYDIGTAKQGKVLSPKDICDDLGLTEQDECSNVRVALNRLRAEEKRDNDTDG